MTHATSNSRGGNFYTVITLTNHSRRPLPPSPRTRAAAAYLEHLHWHLGSGRQTGRDADIDGRGLGRGGLWVLGGLLSLLLPPLLLLKLLPHQLLAKQDAWCHGRGAQRGLGGAVLVRRAAGRRRVGGFWGEKEMSDEWAGRRRGCEDSKGQRVITERGQTEVRRGRRGQANETREERD